MFPGFFWAPTGKTKLHKPLEAYNLSLECVRVLQNIMASPRQAHRHGHRHTHTHTQTRTHTHIHTQTYTHIHTYTHTQIHTHTNIQTYRHTDIHAHTHIHTYTHTHIHTYTHSRVHIHTYTHTTHAHTHTHPPFPCVHKQGRLREVELGHLKVVVSCLFKSHGCLEVPQCYRKSNSLMKLGPFSESPDSIRTERNSL